MKTKTLKLILLVSVVFNITIIAAAGFFYFRDSWCAVEKRGRGADLAQKLDLTKEQEASMKEADARFRKDAREMRAGLLKRREALLGLIREGSPDRASIESELREMNALQGQIEAAAVEHMLEEKALLTPEQREKYLKLLEKRFERGKERMERRFGREVSDERKP
jgi:Spy/CpxP family protein refolding chaperone